VPGGAAAYALIPAPTGQASAQDYRIGPLDTVDISVFQEPDLTVRGLVVDSSGNVVMPLIGRVRAAGRTATELSAEIEQRLGANYLRRPQVTVLVSGSVSQRVTVEGQVTEPGVYDLHGPTTLLSTLALAKGETRVASLREVVVFRVIDGQRMGAVFDVGRIRRGDDPDPQILGNDVVIVGYSNLNGLWRDILLAAPLLNVFRPYTGY
jgi:polysaccharide export outer membrane protein